MIQTQPLEVSDFSLGITDYFLDGAQQEAESFDNLFLNPNKKPITRFGSIPLNSQLPLGQFRVPYLLFLQEQLIGFQEKRAYRYNDPSWIEIFGPSGSSTFFPTGSTNIQICSTEWAGQILFCNSDYSTPQKLFKDNLNNYKVVNAGLPDVPNPVSVTNPTGAGQTYLYAFVFKYTYNVGTIQYIDRGNVRLFGPVTGGIIGVGNTTTSTLPTTLSAPENIDTSNLVIEIYRTINAGTTFYKLGEVAFGVSSYIDNKTDAIIQSTGQTLYTTGGVTANEPAPNSKFVHVVNSTGYYANIKDGTELLTNEVRQSIPGDPDSVPASFSTQVEQEIFGLSSIYDRPMIFCKDYIYRIDNFISSTGDGAMEPRRIDDKAGCVSNNSIIRTHAGIFWAGNAGFYWSDGFKVMKISDNINETYKKIVENTTKAVRISAAYDQSTERVFWSVNLNEGDNEADIVFILDLKFGIRPKSTFTTMSGGSSMRPTSMVVNNKKLYRGDIRGFVLVHDNSYFTDPKIDTLRTIPNWTKQTIIYDYKSCFLNFGSTFYRKFVPRILVSAANTTNLSLAINSSNDNNRIVGELKPIRYKNNITWGDVLPLWGDPEAIWNLQGLIEEWRRFPAGGLRCNYKQVQFTNAIVPIVDNTLLGQTTVNNILKTATLSGSFSWIPDMEDYTISFSNDNFTREFIIVSQSGNTLTFLDAGGESVSGTYDFVVKGKPKGEVLQLNGFVIHWAMISKSHQPFISGGS